MWTYTGTLSIPASTDLRGGRKTEPAEEPPGTGPGCHLAQPASAAGQLTQLAARTSSQIAHPGLPTLSADRKCFGPPFSLL